MFKTRKPRQFNLKGRYFDEDRDRRDSVLRKNEDKIPFDDKEKYRARLRDNWDYRRSTRGSSNFGIRVIVIVGILVLLLYLLFFIL